jgi:hypothetical protein
MYIEFLRAAARKFDLQIRGFSLLKRPAECIVEGRVANNFAKTTALNRIIVTGKSRASRLIGRSDPHIETDYQHTFASAF